MYVGSKQQCADKQDKIEESESEPESGVNISNKWDRQV